MEISKAKINNSPEDAGYRSDRLDVLDKLLTKFIDEKRIQCAMYAMAKDSKIVAARGMGLQRYDNESLTCPHDAIRGVASVTKLFTATAIMKLVEDGVLDTAQTVKTVIDEFDTPIHRTITIRHLLNHTSALAPDQGVYPDPYSIPWDDVATDKNYEGSWLQAVLSRPLVSEIGGKWSYSSTGYIILGEIITRVTGVKVEDWITDNIIKPLGMTDTYYDVPKEKWDRVIALDDDWSDPYIWDENKRKYEEEMSRTGRKPLHIHKTGWGIFSTTHDLLKFGQMLLNKGEYSGARILSRKTVELMIAECAYGARDFCWGAPGNVKHYGLGPELYGLNRPCLFSPSTFGHEGSGRCGLYIDPEENFVTIFFVPTTKDWDSETIINVSNVIWSGII